MPQDKYHNPVNEVARDIYREKELRKKAEKAVRGK
jgi:hypothetical protein